jgi:hypothetical protein
LLALTPIAAAAFGVPQFLPQLLRLRATGDAAGVSWAWAALTAVNNLAWTAYFALSRYWTALVPSCSVTLPARVSKQFVHYPRQAAAQKDQPEQRWVAVRGRNVGTS